MDGQKHKSCGKRKRGRPVGINRIPLSDEERRARNAQYERERRMGNSDAFKDLAVAVDCDPKAKTEEVLVKAIKYIQTKHNVDELNSLRERNKQLQLLLSEMAQSETMYENRSEHSFCDEQFITKTHTNGNAIKKQKTISTELIYEKQISMPRDETRNLQLNTHGRTHNSAPSTLRVSQIATKETLSTNETKPFELTTPMSVDAMFYSEYQPFSHYPVTNCFNAHVIAKPEIQPEWPDKNIRPVYSEKNHYEQHVNFKTPSSATCTASYDASNQFIKLPCRQYSLTVEDNRSVDSAHLPDIEEVKTSQLGLDIYLGEIRPVSLEDVECDKVFVNTRFTNMNYEAYL